jgi:hypothetical protein
MPTDRTPTDHMPTDHNPAFRAVDTVSAAVFEAGSAVRSARIFHPTGVGFRSTISIRPPADGAHALGVPLLDSPGTYSGPVRISRGAGLPEPLPDILGIAVRIEDAHGLGQAQDLLFGSSSSLPVGRQLFVPNVDFAGLTLSSILPYSLGGGGTYWFGARVLTSSGRLSRLADVAAAAQDIRIELLLAGRFGPWRPVADVSLDEQLPDPESAALRYNVDDNTGGGIEPTGWLQALRRHAYAASQAGRRASG